MKVTLILTFFQTNSKGENLPIMKWFIACQKKYVHYVKSVQIRSFFWSGPEKIRIWTEMFFFFRLSLKEVDRGERLYSQQLINQWWNNPGPTEKFSLITFPCLGLFKTPVYNSWGNSNQPKCILSRGSKVLTNIDQRNQALKLLLVNLAS